MSDMVRDDAWAHAALSYDFDTDSKDNYIQARFRNAIVRVRKAECCAVCFGEVIVGTFARVEVVKMDGELLSARYCQECCDAMGAWPELDAMEYRYDLGQKRAKSRCKR